MRKLAVLCLGLAVGLALASGERWIGRIPAVCCPNPHPQPGVFLPSTTLFPTNTDTMKYDDNTGQNAWVQGVAGGGWGMKFISPSDNLTLQGAMFSFWDTSFPHPGDSLASIRVYADDGANGGPGTQLFAKDSVKITRGAWNYIPIGVSVVAQNFYVFYKQVGANPNAPALSIDANNNAPSHRKWSMDATGNFNEDFTQGDWMIRAVISWTPQDTNAASVEFATNMPNDTVPNINFQIRTVVKNMGSDTLPVGTPVRLHITGPSGYVFDTAKATTAKLAHGATAQIAFTPSWHIPATDGDYFIKSWTQAAGEKWAADDTIEYDLSVAKWIQYHTDANMHFLTWASPERAVKFHPADFSGLSYPIGITRLRADFYLDPSHTWPDSSFMFDVYGNDGDTLLYQSDTVEALPGTPGAYTVHDVSPMLIVNSGDFYVAVEPVSSTGYPSSCADSGTTGGHSYYGSPGSWTPWYSYSDFFISAAVHSGVGIDEGFEPGYTKPSLQISNYPNPVHDQVSLKWQVPSSMPLSVNLYDATGRLVRNLYTVNAKARVGTLTVDTRTLAAGIYLVRLETSQGSATRKLVIDR